MQVRLGFPSLVFPVSGLALLLLGFSTPQAQAAIITFDNLPGNNGDIFTTYSEGGFTVSALTGDVRVAKISGNPVPDISGESAFSVQVTRTGNQSFTFSSADLASGTSLSNRNYIITGFLGASQVLTQSGSVSDAFSTVASTGLTTVLDRLVIEFTPFASSANIDNINVTPTAVSTDAPEPGSLALLLPVLGVAGMTVKAVRTRRKN